jgi:hypothetical protein
MLVFPGAAVHAQARSAAPVALVTELSGKAETQVEGKTVTVSLLSEFHPGARVKLYQGAKMIVLFYRTAGQSAITGPSLIRVGETAVEALSGNEPTNMQALAGKNGKPLLIRPAGVTQGAVVIRGLNKPIPAISLAGGTTLEARPTFRWREVEPGLDYQFTLKDQGDAVLLTRTGRGTALQLPPELVLSEGQRYRWSLFARAPDSTAYGSSYRFTVADAATRADVENFRPAQTANASERVAFAVWLEQAGLNDEAVHYWQQLVAEGIPPPPNKSANAK